MPTDPDPGHYRWRRSPDPPIENSASIERENEPVEPVDALNVVLDDDVIPQEEDTSVPTPNSIL